MLLNKATIENFEQHLLTFERIEKVLSRMEKDHHLYEQVKDVITRFEGVDKMLDFEKKLIIGLIAKGY